MKEGLATALQAKVTENCPLHPPAKVRNLEVLL